MKLLFVFISVLAVLPINASEPQPFAPVPFRLESSRFYQSAPPFYWSSEIDDPIALLAEPFRGADVRLDLPIGPVRIHYGIPIRSDAHDETSRPRFDFLDAPGPGYREQSGRFHR